MNENVFKIAAAVGSAAVSIVGGVSGAVFHPYGPFRSQPEVCPPAITCVIVAGLPGDVNFGPSAGGEAFGFDLEDEIAGRLVGWLEDSGNLRVYKLPEEIAMPERGVAGYERHAQETMVRAREVGARYNAQLVVIGEVNSTRVSLTFVDPNMESATLQLTEYELPSIGVPNNFQSNFRTALANARANRPTETRISSTGAHAPPGGSGNTVGGGATPPALPTQPHNDPTSFPQTSTDTPSSATQAVIVPASIRSRPSAAELTRAYPERALERGLSGEATVLCYVGLNGRLDDCDIAEESPAGMGFGRAAVRLAQRNTFATPQTVDGAAVANGPIEVRYAFEMRPEN